jgi:hypothetical protein
MFFRSGGSHRYSPATRPDTLVTMATMTTLTGPKMGHLLIGAVGIRHHLGVLSCIWGSFGRLLVSFRKKGFLRDALGLPLAPPWGLGASGPYVGRGRPPFFPFLAWCWIPPSSADFGTCPGNLSWLLGLRLKSECSICSYLRYICYSLHCKSGILS